VETPKSNNKFQCSQILTRLLLENSRLQAFFRYDPRLGRMFRILTIFIVQFHSLFVSTFLYGFIHSNATNIEWYDILFLSVLTTLFNVPCIFIFMRAITLLGKEEFIHKYPILFEEYKKRSEFEKYAILYKMTNKRGDKVANDEIDKTSLSFLNEADSISDIILMYLCCSLRTSQKESTILKNMSKDEIFSKLIKIIETPYNKFNKYSSWWEFLPCHTLYGGICLTAFLGWFGWCLNYLLLFASYHSNDVGEKILFTYITSELSTVFISQPLTLLLSLFGFIYLHKYKDRLPWILSVIVNTSPKNKIPPVFYFSNPWNSESNSSLTSELAYTIFVKCAAVASNVDENAYAPLKSILDKINNETKKKTELDIYIKKLYTSIYDYSYKRNNSRNFL
jgi:hypothetical protein